jgi:hypothetical protein
VSGPFGTTVYSVGGLVLPSVDANGVTWSTVGVTGWHDGPGVVLSQVKMPRMDGSWRGKNTRTPRLITIPGWAQAPSKQARITAQDQLTSLLYGGGQSTLTVTDDYLNPRTALVELAADIKALAIGPSGIDYQIVLSAADPRKYEAPATTSTTLPITTPTGIDFTTGGGIDFVTGGGVNFGAQQSNGTLTMTNTGYAESDPIFTITGPSDSGTLINPSITNSTTGQVIAYNGTLQLNDVLVINTSRFARSVTLNGSIDMWAALSVAQWFAVQPKSSLTVQFQGSSTSLTPLLTASVSAAYI